MPFNLTRQNRPDKPILFSAPMVLALLDGSKTQTRRIVKPKDNVLVARAVCPYGIVGSYLWVREAWTSGAVSTFYRASDEDEAIKRGAKLRWRPGIHMHRYRSRLTLKITHIRMEPLRSISASDVIAEGLNPDVRGVDAIGRADIRIMAYAELWDSINGEGSWAKNPLVWVLTFEVIKKNIDEVLQ